MTGQWIADIRDAMQLTPEADPQQPVAALESCRSVSGQWTGVCRGDGPCQCPPYTEMIPPHSDLRGQQRYAETSVGAGGFARREKASPAFRRAAS